MEKLIAWKRALLLRTFGFFLVTAAAFLGQTSMAYAVPAIKVTPSASCQKNNGVINISIWTNGYSPSQLQVYLDTTSSTPIAVSSNYTVVISPVSSGPHTIIVVASSGQNVSVTVNLPQCVKTGQVVVKKIVVNNTSYPTGNTVFPVTLSCKPGGISTTLVLSNANGYSATPQQVAVGSSCQIQEAQGIKAPDGCQWVTTYPKGQTVNVAMTASYLMAVQNELVCARCPPGTKEQTFPGTKVKFCCKDGPLDPRSKRFCCERETPIGRDEPDRRH